MFVLRVHANDARVLDDVWLAITVTVAGLEDRRVKVIKFARAAEIRPALFVAVEGLHPAPSLSKADTRKEMQCVWTDAKIK